MKKDNDLANSGGIFILTAVGFIYFGKYALYTVAILIVFLLIVYAIRVIFDPESILARYDDEYPEPGSYCSPYDQYRQTGVDTRKISSPEKPDKSRQPKTCQPCRFTGVANMESQVFEWGDWSKNKK